MEMLIWKEEIEEAYRHQKIEEVQQKEHREAGRFNSGQPSAAAASSHAVCACKSLTHELAANCTAARAFEGPSLLLAGRRNSRIRHRFCHHQPVPTRLLPAAHRRPKRSLRACNAGLRDIVRVLFGAHGTCCSAGARVGIRFKQ